MLDTRDYYINGIFREGLYLQDLENSKHTKTNNTCNDIFDFEINDEEEVII